MRQLESGNGWHGRRAARTPARARRWIRHGRVAGLSGVLLALGAGAPALAGPLYPHGPSAAPSAGGGGVLSAPGPYLLQLPALNPAPAGPVMHAPFACTRPGTEIAEVRFAALRTRAPSHLEARVLANGGRHWGLGDAAFPVSPAGGQQFAIPLPSGTCSAGFELFQLEPRAQHQRGYFIDGLIMIERDIAPPALSLASLTPGWITGNEARVEWVIDDNYGAAGIGAQRIHLSGSERWSGRPGPGRHGVTVALTGLGDGRHAARVSAEGEGTPGAAAEGEILIDRTPPQLGLALVRTGPYAIRMAIGVVDTASGAREWEVRAGSPAGPLISSSAAPMATADLREHFPVGGPVRAYLRASDIAGNQAGWSASNAVDLSPRPPVNVRPPGIEGSAEVGATLSAKPGAWADPSGRAVTVVHQWERCNADGEACAPVPDENRATYRLSDADRGKTIRLAEGAIGAEAVALARSPSTPDVRVAGRAQAAPGEAAGPEASADPALAGLRTGPLRVLRARPGALPHWRGPWRGRVVATAVLRTAEGAPAPGQRVVLADPRGRVVARALTGPRGGYVLRARAARGGIWRAMVPGAPRLTQRARLSVRALIRQPRRSFRVRGDGGLLTVAGWVAPAAQSGRKAVQLQYRSEGRWRVAAQGKTDAGGRYRLRYRFRVPGRYDLRARVVAPSERGWAFAPAISRPILVRVG